MTAQVARESFQERFYNVIREGKKFLCAVQNSKFSYENKKKESVTVIM